MKNKLFILLLVVSGIWGFSSLSVEDKCVNVYVDFGSLNNNKKIIECIDTEKEMLALDLFNKSGLQLEGTNKYGLQVVCRVNNLPDRKQESCDVMPPENAYWAFIVKEKRSAVNMFPKWGWAQRGVSEVYFKPGDSLGLVFSENGDLSWPD